MPDPTPSAPTAEMLAQEALRLFDLHGANLVQQAYAQACCTRDSFRYLLAVLTALARSEPPTTLTNACGKERAKKGTTVADTPSAPTAEMLAQEAKRLLEDLAEIARYGHGPGRERRDGVVRNLGTAIDRLAALARSEPPTEGKIQAVATPTSGVAEWEDLSTGGWKQPSLTDRLQQKCSDWGTYWRASDAHGVILTPEQAVELLQDALGVEVEIEATPVASDRDSLLPASQPSEPPTGEPVAISDERIRAALTTASNGVLDGEGDKPGISAVRALLAEARAPGAVPEGKDGEDAEALLDVLRLVVEICPHRPTLKLVLGILQIEDGGVGIRTEADLDAAIAKHRAAPPIEAQAGERCPTCNGNDGDMPCGNPSRGAPGCLRDKRLAQEQEAPQAVASRLDAVDSVQEPHDRCKFANGGARCVRWCGDAVCQEPKPLTKAQQTLLAHSRDLNQEIDK